MTITYGSLFSGVGGFDLGLDAAGMRCLWQVEIDKQARAVLRHRWPDVPKYEDVCNVGAAELVRPDLICGGFPCQDLSVAGRRAGLAGERSGLFHEFMRIVAELAPRWVLLENVPGLLSSNGGRDMGTVLGTLGKLGYGYAYRVLDLQHFGVPQRRRRVFIVAHSGGICPPEILFEPESLRGDSSPSGEAGEGSAGFATAGTLDARTTAGGFPGTDGAASGHVVTSCVNAHQATGDGFWRVGLGPLATSDDNGTNQIVAPAVAFKASHYTRGKDGAPSEIYPPLSADADKGDQDPVVLAFHQTHDPINDPERSPALGTTSSGMGVLATLQEVGKRTGKSTDDPRAGIGIGAGDEPMYSLQAGAQHGIVQAIPRRLTPVECERLMGWPDGHTRYGVTDGGEWVEMADGPRYRMCGNGVGAPVASWIANRITQSEAT